VTSPRAYIPLILVFSNSSTSMAPSFLVFIPVYSNPSPSVLGILPVAIKTFSTISISI
jgi:hypothetical protein